MCWRCVQCWRWPAARRMPMRSGAYSLYFQYTWGCVKPAVCRALPPARARLISGCPSYSPYLTSGGLLGVGTSSPTATLQVSGSFIVSSSGQTSSPSLYVGTNGNVGIGTTSAASYADHSSDGHVTNQRSLRITITLARELTMAFKLMDVEIILALGLNDNGRPFTVHR